MEASLVSNNNCVLQVRRLHIVYFLSRTGHNEHPHLIRVHHINRTGVYLKDVKRWLSDLRGKDMPEAFAWSYKRKYKSGYVWQDLVDDDLITPISDNEYVLKGSEIFSYPSFGTNDAYGEGPDMHKEASVSDDELRDQQMSPKLAEQELGDSRSNTPIGTASEIYHESPFYSSGMSTYTDESMKQEDFDDSSKQKSDHQHHRVHPQNSDDLQSTAGFYSNLLNNSGNQGNKNDKMSNLSTCPSPLGSASPQSPLDKSKNSAKNGMSRMLRNLIPCRGADTIDAALVNLNKSSLKKAKYTEELGAPSEVHKGEGVGGSSRSFRAQWNQQQEQHNARKSFDESRTSKNQQQKQQQRKQLAPFCGSDESAAYKPVGAPKCTQCGKSFRPEKLHSHMKSCRGMRANSRSTATTFTSASFEQENPISSDGAYQLVPVA